MIKKLTKFIFNEIIYNGHLQSLGAAGIVYISSSLILHRSVAWDIMIVTYSMFQFVYTHDRFKHIRIDTKTNIQRTQHLKIYLDKVPFLLFFYGALVLLGNLIYSNFASLLLSAVIMFLGFMYTLYFKRLTKRIFLFKDIYVSSVFSLLLFFPAVYHSVNLYNFTILSILLLLVFSESMINQIALDSKDFAVDKKEGLLTLPVVLGSKNSLNLLRWLSLMSGIIFVIIMWYFQLNLVFTILVAISLLINQLSLKMIYETKKSGYAISAGKFFTWLLVVLVLIR